MAKVIRVGQAVGTLNVSLAGGGDSRDVLDERINKKLVDEGWDDVSSSVIHVNKAGEEVSSLVILYTYKEYEKDTVETKAKK